MMDFLDSYLEMTKEERIFDAKESVALIEKFCKKKKLDASLVLQDLFVLFVCASNKGLEEKYEFFQEVLGRKESFMEFLDLLENGTEYDFVMGVKDLCDSMKRKYRYAAYLFGAAIITCKGEVTLSEEKLMELMLSGN